MADNSSMHVRNRRRIHRLVVTASICESWTSEFITFMDVPAAVRGKTEPAGLRPCVRMGNPSELWMN